MDNHKKVIVTGANGFIGRNLCAFLKEKGYIVRAAVRSNVHNVSGVDEYVQVGDINESTDWRRALQGVDFVVHLAGRAHVMDEQESDPDSVYHRVNALGTKRLAEQAAQGGVKRFTFVSSVKVNGEANINHPFTEESSVNPHDPYAVSKWEAECILRDIAEKSSLEIIILRLPLVYGPGVGGNFLRLLHWVYKGVPLPFRNINNRRSLLALENLVDLLALCVWHPRVGGETFLVSDGEDLSTPELINRLSHKLGRPNRLLPFPEAFLRFGAQLLGRGADVERLLGSLVVDSSKVRRKLNWLPPFSVEEGLDSTARWYLNKFGNIAV